MQSSAGNRRLPTVVACVTTALFILASILQLSFDAEHETRSSPIITVNHFWIYISYFFWLSLLLCVAAGVWALIQRSKVGWLPLLMLITCPFVLFQTVFNGLASQVVGAVKAADGREYRLLSLGSLQGTDWSIVRVESENGFQTRYRSLVDALGDWDLSAYLRVVRPSPEAASPHLYLTKDQKLVAVSAENVVFVAYDLATDVAYDDMDGSHPQVRELSPFLLLGASDQPSEKDFDSLLIKGDAERHTIAENAGRPFRSAVVADLKSANTRVREMARKLLPLLNE